MKPINPSVVETLERKIFLIRGMRVMLDRDLAELYGVSTKALNQAVKRNTERFPESFMFRLTSREMKELVTNCDRFHSLKHAAVNSLAFTEYGVAMLSSILRSERSVRINVQIIQTFIRLRQLAFNHEDIKRKILKLERKVKSHDGLIREIFDAINELETSPKLPAELPRRIGFQP